MEKSLEIRVDASELIALISRIRDAVNAHRPTDVPERFEDVIHIDSSQKVNSDGVLVIKAEPSEWAKQLLARFETEDCRLAASD